jgi:hypothetical protein
MLNEWFYSHKTWQIGLLIDVVLLVVSLFGLRLFHRLVAWHPREEHTHMVGLSYALCGSVYAVIIALVAGSIFETMDKSEGIAAEEANSLAALIFDSSGLGPQTAGVVRGETNRYIDVVTEKEWPCQRAYKMENANFEEGWGILRQISVDLASFEPKSQGQATVKMEMEHDINDLFTARRQRLLAATQHVPGAIWGMLLFGLGVVCIYVYLFGPHSFKIHMAVTAMTVLSIGFVFTLVIAEDYPFRGIVSVDSEAYTDVKEVAERVYHPETAPKEGERTVTPGAER